MQVVSEFDTRKLRDVLGRFATGITVVTIKDARGRYVGRTVNSFNSVSLDPPLVLWSLSLASSSLKSFEAVEYFAVNILSDDQISIAERFARKGERDPFEDLRLSEGAGGAPVLDGCAAAFSCRKHASHYAGDHVIFVGEIAEFYETEKPALVFHYGDYAVSRPHPAAHTRPVEAFFFSSF